MDLFYVPKFPLWEILCTAAVAAVFIVVAIAALIMLCFLYPDLAVIIVMIPVVVALGAGRSRYYDRN
jgi:hypothetical protein